ncbi:MAG TPA: exodeoxyribonuclease V subunit alpha [Mycobacteriales bacterium]|nr:exodeoxyribonuclease V subunit alpha [Mycobacteriales bacterium]
MTVALRATGLLRDYSDAGVLHAADVHVAQRLGALGGESDERVLLALALCVRGVRQGSVALPLADVPGTVTADDADDAEDGVARELPPWPEVDGWLVAVQASPLVGAGRPLRLDAGELWLERYWRQEVAVADDLLRRAASPPDVDDDTLRAALQRLWPGSEADDQRLAAAVCVLSRVAVLGGGPGTGKTTTVARLLAALREVSPGRPPRIALAAPTGKAAARLTESLREAVHGGAATGREPDPVLSDEDAAVLTRLEATTLHRLLGVRRGSTRFRHSAENRLPHDVVVVDETSMVSLTLFARLLEALRPTTRLVLVGDPDQLASVEAGAVLADLVAPARELGLARTTQLAGRLRAVVPHDVGSVPVAVESAAARVRDGVALLRTDRRFDEGGAIARLARAVRDGDTSGALAVLREGTAAVRFDEVSDDADVPSGVVGELRSDAVALGRRLLDAALADRAGDALAVLAEHRLLCAHRRGPRGVAEWSRTVERWWRDELGVQPRRDGRYAGLPLLVTSNDYDNKLFNGDTGVVVQRDGDLVAAFDSGDGVRHLPLGRLGDVRPLHAMTVHRAQGSQFRRVTVLLPATGSPLGTRETLYTAVTRASGGVRVIGSAAAVASAVQRSVARATGLRRRLG